MRAPVTLAGPRAASHSAARSITGNANRSSRRCRAASPIPRPRGPHCRAPDQVRRPARGGRTVGTGFPDDAILDHLGQPANRRADGGTPHRHRLEDRVGKALDGARCERDHVRASEQLGGIGATAQEQDALLDAELGCSSPQAPAFGPSPIRSSLTRGRRSASPWIARGVVRCVPCRVLSTAFTATTASCSSRPSSPRRSASCG